MYLILFGGLENCGKKERKLNLKYYILGFFVVVSLLFYKKMKNLAFLLLIIGDA